MRTSAGQLLEAIEPASEGHVAVIAAKFGG
jgi:hypothetical protein